MDELLVCSDWRFRSVDQQTAVACHATSGEVREISLLCAALAACAQEICDSRDLLRRAMERTGQPLGNLQQALDEAKRFGLLRPITTGACVRSQRAIAPQSVISYTADEAFVQQFNLARATGGWVLVTPQGSDLPELPVVDKAVGHWSQWPELSIEGVAAGQIAALQHDGRVAAVQLGSGSAWRLGRFSDWCWAPLLLASGQDLPPASLPMLPAYGTVLSQLLADRALLVGAELADPLTDPAALLISRLPPAIAGLPVRYRWQRLARQLRCLVTADEARLHDEYSAAWFLQREDEPTPELPPVPNWTKLRADLAAYADSLNAC